MTYDDNAIGPIGAADRELLVALARYVCKARVLEFGSLFGHSAKAWLEGGAEHVTCVEINPTQELITLAENRADRMRLFSLPMETLDPPWKNHYDIVFFDAAHDAEMNMKALLRLQSWLLLFAVVVVHDTGVWAREFMTPEHERFPGEDVAQGKIHQKGELLFVDTLRKSGWDCVTLQSKNALRHGITLCQR